MMYGRTDRQRWLLSRYRDWKHYQVLNIKFMYSLSVANKICKRHDFLSSTIGVMNIEKVSYDNISILLNVVVYIFPFLSFLKICLYLLYQFKVYGNKKSPFSTNHDLVSSMGWYYKWWRKSRIQSNPRGTLVKHSSIWYLDWV